MRAAHANIPVAFISSTSEDLKEYRASARDAAIGATFHPLMMEYFTASGARPPLPECLQRVSEAHVLVVLVAHRYGWVPDDQPGDEHKSITWLECEEAVRGGIEVLAFILDDDFDWPNELREEHRLAAQFRESTATTDSLDEVQRSVGRLRDFKDWLNSQGVRTFFTTPEDLRGRVSDALRDWRSRHAEFATSSAGRIDMRELGLETFSIQEHLVDEHASRFVGRSYAEEEIDDFLQQHSKGYFVIQGEPGQGKTALAAKLVKQRGLVHHFVSRTGGRSDARLILRSLLAQLAPLADVDVAIPDSLPDLTKCLEDLLAQVAEQRRRVIMLIDGVDELDEESATDLSFLTMETLPQGAFVILTSRPGPQIDRSLGLLRGFSVPHKLYRLGPLQLDEMTAILRSSKPGLSEAEIQRIAEASQGNPLYLTTVSEELQRNPGFDLRELPSGIEGFFSRAIGHLRDQSSDIQRTLLGMLAVSRKPLSLRELSQITGERQRLIDEQGIRPMRQFLFETDGKYCFYHARFHDFVTRQLLYEDELPDFHRLLADWLQEPGTAVADYRWTSLAYHLYQAGDAARLMSAVDQEFLTEKLRRFGYAVLEDLELLSLGMLDVGDPALVSRCIELLEGLREVVGGDVIENAGRAVQPYRPGPESFRSEVLAPPIPSVPGLDVYVGMLPKVAVGADFFGVVPHGDRLVLAIGDAPGIGLRGAFVARFVGSLFRRFVRESSRLYLTDMLAKINHVVSAHEYFERISMQCFEIDLRTGILTMANAGHPYPVLYSARRGQCDRLPLRGDLLNNGLSSDASPPCFIQRRAEIGIDDVLVLISDGLTEGHRFTPDRYGYRFAEVVENKANQGAKSVVEAILDDWREYPRGSDYSDDVTVVAVSIGPNS